MDDARTDSLVRNGSRRFVASLPTKVSAQAYRLRPFPSPHTASTTSVTTTPPGGVPMPLAGPARAPEELEGLRALETEFARAARRTWPQLPTADAVAAVEAGILTEAIESAARARQTQPGSSTTGSGGSVAAEVGNAAAVLQRQGLLATTVTPVDWSGFGTVIPVLAGSPGAGTSVLVTLLADVLQLAGRCAMMVDASDPSRSGLAMATRSEGPWLARPHPRVHIRYSWRAQALLARLETTLPVIAPGMVPPPRFWRPPVRELHATIVDLGHDPWRVAANPLTGAGAWLRRGTPMPRPVLVVRPSRPSLLHAEQVLTRLDAWVASAAVAPTTQLVVMGARRWPEGIVGTAGRRVAGLIDDAVFVPHDGEIAASGITAVVTPARLRQAITPVLRRCGLLPESTHKNIRWNFRERS
jgi:hypothetical protein